MRLSQAFEPSSGQLDHPVITDDEIEAGVKGKAIGHGRVQEMGLTWEHSVPTNEASSDYLV